MSTLIDIETSVLIVGAGPVGLALAGDLGWRNIPCIVVEQSDGTIIQPRQDLVGVRTMEFCRRWGIVGDVEAAPYPRDYPQDNIYVAGSLVEGWEIGRYENPSMGDEVPLPQSPQHRERCPQNMFDPVLRKFAGSQSGVALRYRHRFVSVEQHEDHVIVEIEDIGANQTLHIKARYLVGCDGGGSAVRGALGIEMQGNPALTYTTNVIFRRTGFEALHDKKPGYRFVFLKPEGTWATLVAINGRDQWRFSIVRSGDGSRALTEEEIRAYIVEAVGIEFEYDILSVMPWIRRELVAERYRVGNVFIAGDAAHLMSPTGGFGMNTGVGDIIDLSWKIDATLQGWGGNDLLDSYEVERRPVGLRNVAEASGNLGRMLSADDSPQLLDDTDEGAKVRQQAGTHISEAMKREWQSLGIHLGYVYAGSPICIADGTPPPNDDPTDYAQNTWPGSRAPHVWLNDGRSTLDLFGRGFVLLCLDADPVGIQALNDAAEAVGLPLEIILLSEEDVKAAYEQKLVLVRPDGHAAWRGENLPENPAEMIDIVRGAAVRQEKMI
jgi:2-polyprenyl-6-methoxyphenol hydroxylase-like FAD-dependent oxidoreductase